MKQFHGRWHQICNSSLYYEQIFYRHRRVVLLVQLPPSLNFKFDVAAPFIETLRSLFPRRIVWEPRHPSWSSAKALELLSEFDISKVIADPEPCPLPENSELSKSFYFRLHGSPEIYKSKYSQNDLQNWLKRLENSSQNELWCIFDNTTFGFATEDALETQKLLHY